MARRRDRTVAAATLPGYRDIVEIGGGAFANVYRAVEIDTGRPVALKILKVDTVHPHLIETFTQEIQALAQVSDHPNIVTFYRPLVTPDQRPVLVLELCRESLAQLVRRQGPIEASEVTRIGIKIAGALETAHLHGFLHRDMKPQNILLSQFGEPVLGDFGVAALQASAQATAGVFGFTTLHAAPEILEGHHLSAATDVYGLASTMYQLLSGLAPFATFDNEAPASVILRIIRDPVRPLRAEGIPLALSDLLEAALAKEPSGRPRTAVEFADALVAVEAAAGWPATSYVAWGASPAGPAGAEAAAGRSGPVRAGGGAGVAPGPPVTVAPQPPPRAGLYASAPSLALPDVAQPRPVVTPSSDAPSPPAPGEPAPPLPAPASPPLPAPASPPPLSPPSEAPLLPPAEPLQAAARPTPPAPAPRPGPPPPAPLPRTRPSVMAPRSADRNVITPGQLRRGPHQGSLGELAPPPLPPLRVPAWGQSPDGQPGPAPRPVFVDPDLVAPGAGPTDAGRGPSPPASVYEETILPAGPLSHRTDAAASGPAASPLLNSPWAVGGIAAAVIVIVAAVLLLLGVL